MIFLCFSGDIAITLIQSLSFRGSVIVTTPQRLSYVDVVKGIELFQKTAVPIVALVENMSFFLCDSCDRQHSIFGPSHLPLIRSNYSTIQESQTFQFPILPSICTAGDAGDPFVLGSESANKQNSLARAIYSELAASVDSQCERMFNETRKIPKVQFDQKLQLIAIESTEGEIRYANPRELRLACRCAGCVDEFTGQRTIKPELIPTSVRPTGIQPRGNYAVAMAWSDGHASSLYPLTEISKIAKETPEEARKSSVEEQKKETLLK